MALNYGQIFGVVTTKFLTLKRFLALGNRLSDFSKDGIEPRFERLL